MRSSRVLPVSLVCALVTCCENTEDRRPPPIHVTAGSSPGIISGVGGGGEGDGGGTLGGGGTVGGGTLDAGGPGTGLTLDAGDLDGLTFGGGTFESAGTFEDGGTLGDASVLSGSILTDDALFPLPMECTLRLHEPGAVDPGTGLSSGALLDVPLFVGETQQRYDIGQDEVQRIVNQGDLVYVEVRCDIDGDGSFDEFGGWYPLLPAEIVELPAQDIDLVVGELPV